MPAKVPGNLFGGVGSGKTVKPESSNEAKPQSGNTVNRFKETFYLDPVLSDKLDELKLEYKKRTGHKINRQDVIRRLIENCKIEDLL